MIKSFALVSALLLPAFANAAAPPPVSLGGPTLKFGYDLLQRHADEETNLVFSPTSIHMALSMTSLGARGETLTAMEKTLGYSAKDGEADPHATYKQFLAQLWPMTNMGRPNPDTLSIANSLWLAKGYPIVKEFGDQVGETYHGSIASLDFAGDTAGAIKTINRDIAMKTNDRITNLLDAQSITPVTRLVLTNAVYLKAEWANTFKKDGTFPSPFTKRDGKKIDVPTMHVTGEYRLADTDKVQVLEMSYRDGKMSLLIIVPKDDLKLAFQKDGIQQLDDLYDKLETKKVTVSLPKFKIASTLPLKADLPGMAIAFSDKADFSGISTHEELKIDKVLHQANIDVDEKGTEAAAATAVMIAPTAARPDRDEPVPFVADRPFVFVLRHTETGAILFLGRVFDPTAK